MYTSEINNSQAKMPFILPIINIDESNSTESGYSEEEPSNENKIVFDKKKNRKEVYGKGNEAKSIKDELGDFNVYQSDAYIKVVKQFGHSIRFSELLGIINSIQIFLQMKENKTLPHVSRNEKRSFQLLIKYIETNKELIFPYLPYISLCNSSFQKIPLDIK